MERWRMSDCIVVEGAEESVWGMQGKGKGADSEQHGVPKHTAWTLSWREVSNEELGRDQMCTGELRLNACVVRREMGM